MVVNTCSNFLIPTGTDKFIEIWMNVLRACCGSIVYLDVCMMRYWTTKALSWKINMLSFFHRQSLSILLNSLVEKIGFVCLGSVTLSVCLLVLMPKGREGTLKDNQIVLMTIEVDCGLWFSVMAHRPSLPEDIIALGDPQPLPQILKIGSQVTPAPPPVTLATLSLEDINEIFNRVIGHSIKRYGANLTV